MKLLIHIEHDDNGIQIFNNFYYFFAYRPVSAYALFFRDTQASIKGNYYLLKMIMMRILINV